MSFLPYLRGKTRRRFGAKCVWNRGTSPSLWSARYWKVQWRRLFVRLLFSTTMGSRFRSAATTAASSDDATRGAAGPRSQLA